MFEKTRTVKSISTSRGGERYPLCWQDQLQKDLYLHLVSQIVVEMQRGLMTVKFSSGFGFPAGQSPLTAC